MEELRSVEQVGCFLKKNAGKSIGLVPTMGYFHKGHESLIQACVEENDVGIVSIFVNPAQFAPGEDLASYPRSEERDKRICEALGCKGVFVPEVEEVYGKEFGTWVESEVGTAQRNAQSEGWYRPTFFKGVATMVTKLMCLIRPDRIYFGQKDGQQVAVVKRVIQDLWLGDADCVRVCETVRESDGLAMSSRNTYLTVKERKIAAELFRGMQVGKAVAERESQIACSKGGRMMSVEAEKIRKSVRKYVENEWKGKEGAELIYVSVCDKSTFQEVSEVVFDKRNALLCVAAKLGTCRLIDNITI